MRTESTNPVLTRPDVFTREGYAGFHDAPGTTAAQEALGQPVGQGAPPLNSVAMTVNDVIVKTFLLFVIGAVGVAVSWATGFSFLLTMVGMVAGLVLGIVATVKKQVSVPLILGYAFAQGLFLAGISASLQSYVSDGDPNAPNIVMQAVLGTAVAFAVMLSLYASGKLRATPKFKKMMIVALVSYGVIALASFVSSFFGVGDGFGFYGVGLVGIGLCALGVALAAFTLILDFDAIESAIAMGVPEKESWRAALGLMVTLVWLYIEILRLLAILQGRD